MINDYPDSIDLFLDAAKFGAFLTKADEVKQILKKVTKSS